MIRGNVIYDASKINNIWPKFLVNTNSIDDGAVQRIDSAGQIPSNLGVTQVLVEATGVDPAFATDNNAIYGKIYVGGSVQSYVIHSQYGLAPTTTPAPSVPGWITFNGTANTIEQKYSDANPDITVVIVKYIPQFENRLGKFAFIPSLNAVVSVKL